MSSVAALLQAKLDAMPPVRAMAVQVVSVTPDRVCLHAPLAANVNDKGCAFGGSIAGLMTLAGWGLLVARAQALELPALEVYVADSRIRYLAPLYQAIAAQAWLADASCWDAIEQRLHQRGRASLNVQAQVLGPDGEPVASMDARFALVMSSMAGDATQLG
ncbi:MAG: YiiD C-terminal domain-containing protein [Xanthomonadaceae bacterium]|nr:YiiD C-terminal domain-containing protein [Xanthomonadaceae bacterium]MDP2186520.1 YiiD C-terminal domain-containing protein [Xanthomonadales bacterium]MDZ4117083.1 YiiD C-terminal domain-containing protein [Xanthomonadaceae bacterium]MDZ4379266.1 YiiD C-terminal domain-containing protein [Xanthomonadaceae bacterium]